MSRLTQGVTHPWGSWGGGGGEGLLLVRGLDTADDLTCSDCLAELLPTDAGLRLAHDSVRPAKP